MTALDLFADMTRWVAWRYELRNGKPTKVPYSPQAGKAKADDPRTWGTRTAAERMAQQIANGAGGGIGIMLGDLGDGTVLGGIDLDTCIGDDGASTSWADAILAAVPTYAERSPSGNGSSCSSACLPIRCDRSSTGSARMPARSAASGCPRARTAPTTARPSNATSLAAISR
jgi:primase-polymerase (primpol)-like protein